ncbi:hypothetical protein [Tellurirhabdus rosea]|uniref:hypothetical protein n=1 Tax=Tellurirhabdus rosea TaxID=2674997 RepID=UPI0022573C4E|nr:hypothetical protein [Tellurirhabdus rosea]
MSTGYFGKDYTSLLTNGNPAKNYSYLSTEAGRNLPEICGSEKTARKILKNWQKMIFCALSSELPLLNWQELSSFCNISI